MAGGRESSRTRLATRDGHEQVVLSLAEAHARHATRLQVLQIGHLAEARHPVAAIQTLADAEVPGVQEVVELGLAECGDELVSGSDGVSCVAGELHELVASEIALDAVDRLAEKVRLARKHAGGVFTGGDLDGLAFRGDRLRRLFLVVGRSHDMGGRTRRVHVNGHRTGDAHTNPQTLSLECIEDVADGLLK